MKSPVRLSLVLFLSLVPRAKGNRVTRSLLLRSARPPDHHDRPVPHYYQAGAGGRAGQRPTPITRAMRGTCATSPRRRICSSPSWGPRTRATTPRSTSRITACSRSTRRALPQGGRIRRHWRRPYARALHPGGLCRRAGGEGWIAPRRQDPGRGGAPLRPGALLPRPGRPGGVLTIERRRGGPTREVGVTPRTINPRQEWLRPGNSARR